MSKSTEQWAPVDLPSLMAPYDTKEFFMRPLLAGEVKRLKPALMKGEAYAILDIMKATMKPLVPDDLTTGDVWFAAAWLRVNTFPNIPLIRHWTCPKCRAANDFIVDLSKMEMEELPADYQEPIEFTLLTEKKLTLRLSRAGDARKVRDYLKTLRGGDPDDAEMSVAELAIMIKNGESLEDRIKFVENELTPEELVELEDFNRYFSHGLPSHVSATCKECEYENTRVRMSFRIHDIIPLSGTGRDIRNAIQFGKTPSSDSD